MNSFDVNVLSLRIVDRVKTELREIEDMSSVLLMKERINGLLKFIDSETVDNKIILEEMIFQKVKETKGVNADLHTHLYILYRNLSQNKIDTQEAKRLFNSYINNF